MRVAEKVEVLARRQRIPKLSRSLCWIAGPASVLMEPHQPHQMWLVIIVTFRL